MSTARSEPSGPKGTAVLITVAALVFLGAMALAIPAAPIEVAEGARHGRLVRHSHVSEGLAIQLAGSGYGFVAVDLTTARLEADALWRNHVEAVARRRFPVWGWVDTSRSALDPETLLDRLPLAGLFLDGPGAVELAARMRLDRTGVVIVPVLRRGDARPEDGSPCAVVMDREAFLARAESETILTPEEEDTLPVLVADRLTEEQIEEARAAVGDRRRCLVARVALPASG